MRRARYSEIKVPRVILERSVSVVKNLARQVNKGFYHFHSTNFPYKSKFEIREVFAHKKAPLSEKGA